MASHQGVELSDKHAVRLDGSQETLLIPLYGRAIETAKPDGVLSDPKAVEMVEAIDYPFARFDGTSAVTGCVVRTAIFDHWVRAFLDRHPAGSVIEIGCGLNTRFERLDNGTVSWVDLDLPDAIALRREFFTDTPRRRMLAASVVDEGWVEVAHALPGPYFLVAEASLIYLTPAEAHRAVGLMAERFGGSQLAFDTCGQWFLDNQYRHEVLKDYVRMTWACDDPRELELLAPGLALLESRTFAQMPEPVLARLPPAYRTRYAGVDAQGRSYRFNLFDIRATPHPGA